jgi:hypothetical protein
MKIEHSLRDTLEEALAKYWYDTEYYFIDKQDDEKAVNILENG